MHHFEAVRCPVCNSNLIHKAGKSKNKEQRYQCMNTECSKKTFRLLYRYRACVHGIKEQIIDMAINGSGVRDTGRVLKISKSTVMKTIKKRTICC